MKEVRLTTIETLENESSIFSLYGVYKDNVEAMILDLIDPDKGNQCMLKYNLMRDDYAFYDKWRKELFEILYKELAGK